MKTYVISYCYVIKDVGYIPDIYYEASLADCVLTAILNLRNKVEIEGEKSISITNIYSE